MGQVAISGAITAGPPAAGSGFPQMVATTVLATTPNPKPFSVATGILSRRVSSPSPAFAPLQGVGPTDTVTKGDFLYLRCDAPIRLRLTKVDPATSPATFTSMEDVQGLFVMEFSSAAPLVLLEAQGAATIEYFISGPQ